MFATQEAGQGIEQRVSLPLNINDIDATAMISTDERAFEAEQHRLMVCGTDPCQSSRLCDAKLSLQKKVNKRLHQIRHGLNVWRLQAASLVRIAAAWSCDEAPLTRNGRQHYNLNKRKNIKIEAVAFPQRRFYPRTKTSFSALAQHLSRRHAYGCFSGWQARKWASCCRRDQSVTCRNGTGNRRAGSAFGMD